MEEEVSDTISQLFEEYADSIYRYASLSLPQYIDAKDVVQEVFLKAYRSWGTFRQNASVRTWLFQIAKNQIYDVLRKLKRDRQKEEYMLTHSSTTTGLGSLLEYEDILRELNPKYREVLILKVMDGLSVEEIASILECSSTAVRVRYHRARRILQELLRTEKTSGRGELV